MTQKHGSNPAMVRRGTRIRGTVQTGYARHWNLLHSTARRDQKTPMVRVPNHHFGLAATSAIDHFARRKTVLHNKPDDFRTVIGVDIDSEVDAGVEVLIMHKTISGALLDRLA